MEQINPKHKQYIIHVIKKHCPGAKIIAFGSRVRGDAQRYSDLDIALKQDLTLSALNLELIAEEFSNSDLAFKIDLVDYHRVSEEFQAIIDREGVLWDSQLHIAN